MAAIEAMPCGGALGGWQGLVLTSGRRFTRRGGLGFLRMRRRPADEEILSLSGTGRFAILSRDGERGKLVAALAADDAAWTPNWSSGERETRSNSHAREKDGDHVPEGHSRELDNFAQDGGSLSRENGAGHQGCVTSISEEESTSRSGRRAFSTLGIFAIAALPSSWGIGDAVAEDPPASAPAKPQKKKGRAPSSPYDEDRLLEQNRRMQRLNNAPTEFPGFVREGFQVKVITSDKYVTSKTGLIYFDMVVGNGDLPEDGQQVIFHYTGYNESGRRVDSSYQQGRPARTRVGIQGMIPGFEEGIKSMRPGGRRIIIVPPELGPPVGPSTFFSAKQFEVFDVELLEAKDCSRRTLLFYSDVVCD